MPTVCHPTMCAVDNLVLFCSRVVHTPGNAFHPETRARSPPYILMLVASRCTFKVDKPNQKGKYRGRTIQIIWRVLASHSLRCSILVRLHTLVKPDNFHYKYIVKSHSVNSSRMPKPIIKNVNYRF